MQEPYFIINAFFDCYGLSQARSLMGRLIRTADSEKKWKGASPSDLLYFSEKTGELIEAVYTITGRYDYHPEVILDKDLEDKCWSLSEYDMYCGWHLNESPWDFFPRHLSKKEFLNPYRALEKFCGYHRMDKWMDIIKDLLFHALSPHSIDEFDDGTGILRTYIHLNKLVEAAHLVDLRTDSKHNKRRKFKWKDREALLASIENNARQNEKPPSPDVNPEKE